MPSHARIHQGSNLRIAGHEHCPQLGHITTGRTSRGASRLLFAFAVTSVSDTHGTHVLRQGLARDKGGSRRYDGGTTWRGYVMAMVRQRRDRTGNTASGVAAATRHGKGIGPHQTVDVVWPERQQRSQSPCDVPGCPHAHSSHKAPNGLAVDRTNRVTT